MIDDKRNIYGTDLWYRLMKGAAAREQNADPRETYDALRNAAPLADYAVQNSCEEPRRSLWRRLASFWKWRAH